MKSLILIFIALTLYIGAEAQINPLFLEPSKIEADRLKKSLVDETNDTLRMAAYRELALYYLDLNSDSAMFFIQQGIPLTKQLKLQLWEADATDLYAIISRTKGLYVQSLKAFNKALALVEDKKSERNIWKISNFTNSQSPEVARLSLLATILSDMVDIYRVTENLDKEYSTAMHALDIATSINDHTVISLAYESLGEVELRNNQLDSALIDFNKALESINTSGYRKYESNVYEKIGDTYFIKGQINKARDSYFKGIVSAKETNNKWAISTLYIALAHLYNSNGKYDSALYYSKAGLLLLEKVKRKESLDIAYRTLAEAYRNIGITDSAWIYFELSTVAKDSLLNSEKIKQLQNIGFDEQLRLQELEKENIEARSRFRTYTLLFSLGVFAIIAFLLYRNNKQKRKANSVLEEALSNLKSTQSQLIHSEKMASLGELTAGIAHEIQNPLNFVNNFSEVSEELVTELKEELEKGDVEEAKDISDDVIENLKKINHHGQRASGIVKGMLEHSRTGDGKKDPTDLNKLADEYLRLAYHGLRAKDKSFNADFKTDFDASLPKIDVIPQDIGRVLLNLINNAFYAVDKKANENIDGYHPEVIISTKKMDETVEISVRDNGAGIPTEIKDKIFQPFFTTKSTGEGTGLGLSLSYDIVTKGHGGKLVTENISGRGTEFKVILPLK